MPPITTGIVDLTTEQQHTCKPTAVVQTIPQIIAENAHDIVVDLSKTQYSHKPILLQHKSLKTEKEKGKIDVKKTNRGKENVKVIQKSVKPNDQSRSCSECSKSYQHRGSLYKHVQLEHPHLNNGSMKCGEMKCSFTCSSEARVT